MAVLTDLASAEIKRTTLKLYGVTTTRPTIFLSDGLNTTYVVDVNIGELDPTGTINQYFAQKKDGSLDKHGKFTNSGLITGIPGQPPEDWQLDDSLPGHIDTTMHNVALARNNAELRYADIGAPVVLNRSDASSAWEVSGFSMLQPGTHVLYPVDLGDMTIGTVIDLTVTTRLLTLAEFGEWAPFGSLALGASALFKGGELISVV
jgi:hypothetical protein